MFRFPVWRTVSSLLVGFCLAGGALAQEGATPRDDLERKLRELERRLEALEARPDEAAEPAAATPEELAEIRRRLDVLAAELERLELGEAAARADRSDHGYGPAASKIYRARPGISFGGYGELLYQSFDDRRDDGSPSGRQDQLDLLRVILYTGYKFDDRWLFNSEIEFEHGSTEEEGSVSVEFAYIDYLWRPELSLRGGLLLVPMGFLNELHEPTVFLGARRPDVERVLLPSTWRENGFGLFGEKGKWSYRAYLLNGLEAAGFSAGGLRGGRQNGSEAVAEDFALVARADYNPRPGLVLGASAYHGGSGQGLEDPAGGTLDVTTTLFEAHAEWRWRGLELRALAARGELDDVARLNAALDLTGADSVGERLSGYYLQAGYDLLAHRGARAQLTPYLRWESYNTQDEVPAGFAADPANDVESLTLGIAFKPIDQVVLKADYQDYDNAAGTGTDSFHVALGFIF